MQNRQNGPEIWILEDDPGTVFTYSETIELDYSVKFFSFMHELATHYEDSTATLPGLLIADLRLPDGSFLKYLKENGAAMSAKFPIVVVSSTDDTQILHMCFAYGAIDYLTKPFSVGELRVKVGRFFRKPANGISGSELEFVLNSKTFEIHAGSKVSPPLTQMEFQIMALLKDASNTTIDKALLSELLHGHKQVGPKALDVQLVNLRRKLITIGYQINSVQNQGIVLCRIERPPLL